MSQDTFDTDLYAVLPLRDIVVFPGMVVPLFVGREKSIAALEEVMRDNKKIFLVAQKDATQDDPQVGDVYKIGTLAAILQLLKLPDGTVKVLVEGNARGRITDFVENEKFFTAHVEVLPEEMGDKKEVEALQRSIISEFDQYIKLNKKIPPEVLPALTQIKDPSKLADTIVTHLAIKISEKQELLEIVNVMKRLEKIYTIIEGEKRSHTERRFAPRQSRVKNSARLLFERQLKAIQKELGENEDGKDEIGELEEKIAKTKLSKEAREKANAELKKLRNMSPMSAEATVVRNYLDWITSIPWNQKTKVKADIKSAEKILNEDHYGLEKVKERILEYLAVQQRTKELKGQILCLVGPPGVGKTSLAKSIARATGRNFVRVSLGGVRDESEIRGHRRTYIGSMPGKIIQSMKKAKSSNPLFLLDEIDKMGSDFRGDPASALLEVLDPEQNGTFNDHYMEVDYDLSDVMFVTTANTTQMPRPLLDRMEIIRLSGYTEDEKVEISKRHLIDKQRKAHGLKPSEWKVQDDALRHVIRHYTREAGVRNLEREVAKLARKSIKDILMNESNSVTVNVKTAKKYLGVEKYEFGEIEKQNQVGITTGLAYTESGGDLLLIEAVTLPGKGKITITGKLGDVMQESVQAAWSYVRSRSKDFGVKHDAFQNQDIHIHFPEGATPKDGPSAGIAICTSIVSVLTGIPVKNTVAMTGEITLRGMVLPIGGLKEKLLAALRRGIKTVLIPKKNVKDLAELPDNVKKGLDIIPVDSVDEVLKVALQGKLKPLKREAKPKEIIEVSTKKSSKEITTH